MKSKDLRRKYIEFFKAKGHVEIPSASLLPENDPSVLFTTAGMSPLVPFLLGEKHPAGARLVNSQKCIRTGDIDEVGDGFHHTFFEMLGHWSFDDYWKDEALKMSFEFVTKELGLDKKYLAVSVFEGDKNAPRDDESIEVWKKLGIDEKRIKPLPKDSNWWEPTGDNGPCGPCTEMFYWTGDKKFVPDVFDPADKNWVEIGNDVLMQYEKVGENKYKIAKQKNIDNGTGLERLLAVMNGLDDDYRTDLFWPIIQKIEELSGKTYDLTPDPLLVKERGTSDTVRSMRIIADHLRAATFIMGDNLGVASSNLDQGYVVRKLIRRAIRHGKLIGIDKNFCSEIAEIIINLMKGVYSELEKNKEFVISNMKEEEEKFRKTLEKGLKVLTTHMRARDKGDIINQENIPNCSPVDGVKGYVPPVITGDWLFDIYQKLGFPLELSLEEIQKEQKINKFDLERIKNEFEEEMKKHQDLSRTASAGKFKGGLANQSEMAIKYHTATHLTLAALRKVLGEHVFQRGSNITDERMRLDFSHGEKMTPEQIKQVENIVNEQIQKNLPVECEEMNVDEAKNSGAMGIFENKYGERVKVYSVGAGDVCFSKEICGGPHVENTSELGHFKILKEEASSAGVRRIKAVLS
ncbi:MAG: alanine--tRNA ligase-related protein [Patescibacteria group bacterium]|nr:alanine--tRNA ligase-related protein [Patescibacteria group bacterium]